MPTLRDIGEFAAIASLCTDMPSRPDVRQGPGDDCAVIAAPTDAYDMLLTSDATIQDVHFDAETPLAAVGHKAFARTFSDIAAMGGRPCWTLCDITAPAETSQAALDELYAAAGALCRCHEAALVGGDLSQGTPLSLHVFTVGQVPKGEALLRSGARAGDLVYVTGSLGGSRSGHHLSFDPRLAQGAWLRPWASACIDLSDGLASDIHHILNRSGCSATLKAERIPLSDAASLQDDDRSPLDHALFDGEDFELLFTLPRERTSTFEAAWHNTFTLACTQIGTVSAVTPGTVTLETATGTSHVLTPGGYDHFKKE